MAKVIAQKIPPKPDPLEMKEKISKSKRSKYSPEDKEEWNTYDILYIHMLDQLLSEKEYYQDLQERLKKVEQEREFLCERYHIDSSKQKANEQVNKSIQQANIKVDRFYSSSKHEQLASANENHIAKQLSEVDVDKIGKGSDSDSEEEEDEEDEDESEEEEYEDEYDEEG